jgi:hypothetical protein
MTEDLMQQCAEMAGYCLWVWVLVLADLSLIMCDTSFVIPTENLWPSY